MAGVRIKIVEEPMKSIIALALIAGFGLASAAYAAPKKVTTEQTAPKKLTAEQMDKITAGVNPHLETFSVTTNPGGVVNSSCGSNPNCVTTTVTFKTTGKP